MTITTGRVRSNLIFASRRELAVITLVSGLAGSYIGALTTGATALTASSVHLSALGASEESRAQISAVLGAAAIVFILIALYAATIVQTSATDRVVAARVRQLALLRLCGASGSALRSGVVRSVVSAGAVGAVAGTVMGALFAHATRVALVAQGALPEASYPVITIATVVAPVLVLVAAALAGWWGSQGVLRVTPAQALDAHLAPKNLRVQTHRGRATSAGLAVLAGVALMGMGATLAEQAATSFLEYVGGFLLTTCGAALFGIGVLVGARFVIPRAVALASSALGRSPSATIARRNAVLEPLRTSQETMTLIFGVALVTTIASGTTALNQAVGRWELAPRERELSRHFFTLTGRVLIAVLVITVILAAVGFISVRALTVLHRQAEVNLLRVLGFTAREVRSMIIMESLALAVTAVALGSLIGVVIGSLGAQSLFGSQTRGFVWGVPWTTLLVVGAGGVLLALIASIQPAGRALRVGSRS